MIDRPGYSESNAHDSALDAAWKSVTIPLEQRRIVDAELERFRAGKPVPPYDALVALLGNVPDCDALEVGCASGYYSEVIALAGLGHRYTGVDYSEAMIRLARECYPEGRFDVADARALPHRDGAFGLVIDGGCLLHVAGTRECVREYARVSARHVILHRVPVCFEGSTARFKKLAYGVACEETLFRELELMRIAHDCGLRLVTFQDIDRRDNYANRSFLFEKVTL